MNHRNNKDNKKSIHSSQIVNQQEHNQSQMEQSKPIKHTNTHRPCLKHRANQPLDNYDETSRLSTYRVSFAHSTLNDGKLLVTSQSQLDFDEKKRRSDMFVKKAKAFQLAELNYFKDHARDKEPIDE